MILYRYIIHGHKKKIYTLLYTYGSIVWQLKIFQVYTHAHVHVHVGILYGTAYSYTCTYCDYTLHVQCIDTVSPPPPSSPEGEVKILTKGDNNAGDDRAGMIYAPSQMWVSKDEIIGRARGYIHVAHTH